MRNEPGAHVRAVERAGYLAHARTRGFQRRLEEARECIREMYLRCRAPFVAYSCGKDSTAMLWLVQEAKPNAVARVLTGGETRLLHADVDAMLAWWREKCPFLDLAEVNIDHVFAAGWETAGFWEQYQTFVGEWAKYLHAAGNWDGVFIGLRNDESNTRRMADRRREDRRYPIRRYVDTRTDGLARVTVACPLAEWSIEDVGALHALHDLPLLAAYADGLDARTKLRVGKTALRMGQVAELRRRDQAAYNRLIARFPELAQWS